MLLPTQGPSSRVYKVGSKANVPTVETFIVIVTAKLNRAQNALEALFTKDIGTNIVTNISEEATMVPSTFPTVLTSVTHDDSQFILNCVRIVLMITTVLLIIALTMSISVNRASRPTSNLVTVTKVNAFIREIITLISGTNAEWKLRKKIHIIRTIRTTVLTNAPIILRTEVNRKLPESTTRASLMFPGRLPSVLLRSPLTPRPILAVPEFVARNIT